MSNKTYDILKWVNLVFLPAFITFIGVVLNCLDFGNTDIVLTILVAFNTFLGSCLGLSNIKYKSKKKK